MFCKCYKVTVRICNSIFGELFHPLAILLTWLTVIRGNRSWFFSSSTSHFSFDVLHNLKNMKEDEVSSPHTFLFLNNNHLLITCEIIFSNGSFPVVESWYTFRSGTFANFLSSDWFFFTVEITSASKLAETRRMCSSAFSTLLAFPVPSDAVKPTT